MSFDWQPIEKFWNEFHSNFCATTGAQQKNQQNCMCVWVDESIPCMMRWFQEMYILWYLLTLYEPRSSTVHVNNASRPTGNVTFDIGALNLGSAEKERENKNISKILNIERHRIQLNDVNSINGTLRCAACEAFQLLMMSYDMLLTCICSPEKILRDLLLYFSKMRRAFAEPA